MSFFENVFEGPHYNRAQHYLGDISGQLHSAYDPYIHAGQQAMGQMQGMEGQYGSMANDPTGLMSSIGSHYKQSPGYQAALHQALQAAGSSAAAGGMAGTPMAQHNAASLATNMANRDYNNYMQTALGLHQQGLAGKTGILGNLYHGGFAASQGLASGLGSMDMSKASLSHAQESDDAQTQQKMFGQMMKVGMQAAMAAMAA